ncbi:MAG: hypothetical protein JXQ66_02120 [Campylobacterales bacterium]|nr:hypothetical protein [Campylobacterales bacterium]
MDNPFESGHIKNYILAYASVVVIMVLFFIASTLFHDIEIQEKKVFETKVVEKKEVSKDEIKEDEPKKFQLMQKSY